MTPSRRPASARKRVSGAILVLLVTALLPASVSRPLGALREPVMTVIAPVAHASAVVAAALDPRGTRRRSIDTQSHEDLRGELDEWKRMYLQSVQRVEDLEARITDLQAGVDPERATRTRLLEATRIGADPRAGTITVSRGERHGVRPGTIAVGRRSQQLVGVVVNVGELTSTIRLITDPRIEPRLIGAVIMPNGPVTADDMPDLPICLLRPKGDGLLVTDKEIGADVAASLQIGQEVRLRDNLWPSTAQMFLLGRISRIEQTRDRDPLHRHLRVRPDLDTDLARVRSVILHVPLDEDAAPAAGSRGRR